MATYHLRCDASDSISWQTGTVDLGGAKSVLVCNSSTDVISWVTSSWSYTSGDPIYLLACDNGTDALSWSHHTNFTFSS